MPFTLKPDYDIVYDRYDAFWHQAVVDRCPVSITLPQKNTVCVPEKHYDSWEAAWLDIDYRSECMAAKLANTRYLADALPIAFPNMGPEVFSAWCGCPYLYGEQTTWTKPIIQDWNRDGAKARMNWEHPLYQLTLRFVDTLLARACGQFLVGLPDFHPGGDHLAALRDPAQLNMDLLLEPEAIKQALKQSYADYFPVYEVFYQRLQQAGMPASTWLPLVHHGRFYVPSNDFSCMISTAMFEEFFLPGIIAECQYYERSIYHLDGPNALRHLDTILAIPDLDAVQWVPGAGSESFERWISVYQRIQQAGKSLQLNIALADLPLVFDTLRPEGVWFAGIAGIREEETAERVLDQITRWRI